jgi:two-component system, chemotaxis family, chemotaxis protein CheY
MDGKTILIIEDDLFTREMYEEILREAGYTVVSAKDGVEGIARIREGNHSLIIMDIMLPNKNGLDILTELKKSPPIETNGPIVIMTNLARDPILNQALGLGAAACIIKTDITPEQLLIRIKGFIAL